MYGTRRSQHPALLVVSNKGTNVFAKSQIAKRGRLSRLTCGQHHWGLARPSY